MCHTLSVTRNPKALAVSCIPRQDVSTDSALTTGALPVAPLLREGWGVVQPMRCLCGAKACRGYIGGTGEALTAEDDVEDLEDASQDPEPIMINGSEAADPTLVAVLESEVGLAPEYWDSAVWQRYATHSDRGIGHHAPAVI